MDEEPNNILKALTSTKPREKGGSLAQDRFDYQNCWALSQLLALHAAGKDYAFAFEFHEDVLRFNSPTKPTEVYFCQVKTKDSGNWTMANLTTRPKSKDAKKLSFIEKLYENTKTFPNCSAQLMFVSNAQFSFFTRTGEMQATGLNVTEKKLLLDTLRKNHVGITDSDLENITFHVSHLPLGKQDEMVLGEILKFFNANLGPECATHVSSWYKAIKKEIEAKGRVNPMLIKTVAEFLESKCLTRAEIQETLANIQKTVKTERNWDVILNLLGHEKLLPMQIFALRDGWNRFSVDQLDSTNTLVQDLVVKLTDVVGSIPDVANKTLSQIAAEGLQMFRAQNPTWSHAHSDDYLKSAILWIVYERRIP